MPIMCILQKQVHPLLYSNMAFNMFSYLFNWGDELWEKSRKARYFLFTPRPLSSKLLSHWCDIIRLGKIHFYSTNPSDSPRFCNSTDIRCPIAIFYSSGDSLVDGAKLTQEMKSLKHVKLHHIEFLQEFEHMDLLWAKNAPIKVFDKIIDAIQSVEKTN